MPRQRDAAARALARAGTARRRARASSAAPCAGQARRRRGRRDRWCRRRPSATPRSRRPARRAPTRRGVTSPADASTAPSTSSALQSARNSARVCSTSVWCSSSTVVGLAQRRRRLERVEARVGEVVDRAHLLDAGAVDLLDLAHEQVERRSTAAAPPRTRRPRRSSPRSSTSMPTMSPSTAPMRDATRPSAPGRSGSHTRTSTWVAGSDGVAHATDAYGWR